MNFLGLIFATLASVIYITKCARYEITVDRVVPLFKNPNDDKIIDMGTVKVKKINRTTYVVDGTGVLKQNFDDNIILFVEAYNMQGGEYRKLFERKLNDSCSLTQTTARVPWEHYRSHTNIPEGCPIPPGTYEIKNFIFDAKNMTPEYIPGGEKWRADVKALDKLKNILGGYSVFLALFRYWKVNLHQISNFDYEF